MTWDVDRWMDEALRRAGEFADPVPPAVLARCDLADRTTAFHDIHTPESMAAAGEARRRLVFDELLRVQLALVLRKRALERTTPGHRATTSAARSCARFHERLPFPLTGAQQRVIGEIEHDLAGPHPDAPAAAGRRRRRQDDRRGRARCSSPCRAGTRAR